jgi:hypothetical protein
VLNVAFHANGREIQKINNAMRENIATKAVKQPPELFRISTLLVFEARCLHGTACRLRRPRLLPHQHVVLPEFNSL